MAKTATPKKIALLKVMLMADLLPEWIDSSAHIIAASPDQIQSGARFFAEF
jgi:hypothetical protein